MKNQNARRMSLAALTVGLSACAFPAGCGATEAGKPVPLDQQIRLNDLQAKGTRATLTVFPVSMGGSTFKDVGNVLAVLLEQAGMADLQTTNLEYRRIEETAFDRTADLFGEFVRENPIKTEYALYAEFVGTPQTGPREIRGVIVDRAGKTVWVDVQTPADRSFKRMKPSDPMTCCVFMAERVRTLLGIPKSARDDSGEGKIARMFAKNSPGPSKAEWAAMERRQAVLKKAGPRAKVAVFPVRLSDDEVGKNDAGHLVKMLNKNRMLAAEVVDSPLRITIQPARNEQKLLWELARVFQDHVKLHPPQADYALLADYIMNPLTGRAWAVHFVVCDRAGEWVIVDYQNDHHSDFKSVDPKTFDDCGRLVARRLTGYLR